MTKKNYSIYVKIIASVLLITGISLVTSCKKSPSEPTQGNPNNQTADANASQPSEQSNIEQSPDVNNTAKTPNAEWVPIEITLPKPVFIGTPQDTRVPNLEPARNEPRP